MNQEFQWFSAIAPIIKQAGNILVSYDRTQLVWKQKDSSFYTQADVASEQYLIEFLARALPESCFFAEESGKSFYQNSYCWVIDPLDGTTNYFYGLPYFCVSIALTFNDEPIAGAIYNPVLHELFYAEKGKGAFLNNKAISVSNSSQLNKTVIGLGLPYRLGKQELIHRAETVAKNVYAIRHFGAVALDLAHVAAGRLDGAFFTGCAWWDVAAGMLLVTEAGGIVTDFEGNLIGPSYKSCLAGNSFVHNGISNLLKK